MENCTKTEKFSIFSAFSYLEWEYFGLGCWEGGGLYGCGI